VEHAKEGVQQLEKAEKYQKGAMPFYCICGLICAIALMLLLLIVKHSGNNF
jgi:t-SNARE complex subunit (syntaxin)